MTTKKKAASSASESVTISAPKFELAEFDIVGTAPYVQLCFPQKVKELMMEKMRLGSQAGKSRKKEARDFDEDFKQAMYETPTGKHGIPAGAFRNAMISACRLVGFKMTLAKLSVFLEADDFDRYEGKPMVYLEGTPEPVISHVRNATGVADLRVRAKFWPWSAKLRVRYDAGLFSASDVANLLARVGMQVGIGEGRPDSKTSAGVGWGTFRLK